MNTSFQGTTSKGNEEWLTPPEYIKALGPFDLDPCSPVKRPWPTAARHYTKEDNGLILPWYGNVWCNPPFDEIETWFGLCIDHGHAMGICYSSTEVNWFFSTIWEESTAILFIRGRTSYYHVDGTKGGSPGKGSVLVAWGDENASRLSMASQTSIPGQYIRLK